MQFAWDAKKRAANIAKHHLDLLLGAQLFDGRNVYTYPSLRGEEIRSVTIGIVNGDLLALVWTRRDDAIRLISLRRARDAEKTAYRARLG
jgi:uncharacterized DUF497 family protein